MPEQGRERTPEGVDTAFTHTHAAESRADRLDHTHAGPALHGHRSLGGPAPEAWNAPDVDLAEGREQTATTEDEVSSSG